MMTVRGQKVVIAEDGQRKVTTLAPAAELQKLIKPNDWNQYAIIARGPEIILKINGAVTSHVIDREKGKAAASGVITLQLHPGHPMKVQFKDIRIKNLPTSQGTSHETHANQPAQFSAYCVRRRATGVSLPYLIPSHVLGGPDRPGANEKVRVGDHRLRRPVRD